MEPCGLIQNSCPNRPLVWQDETRITIHEHRKKKSEVISFLKSISLRLFLFNPCCMPALQYKLLFISQVQAHHRWMCMEKITQQPIILKWFQQPAAGKFPCIWRRQGTTLFPLPIPSTWDYQLAEELATKITVSPKGTEFINWFLKQCSKQVSVNTHYHSSSWSTGLQR